jgi:CrcB protein
MPFSVLMQTIWIGLAGSCGACARYLLSSALTKRVRMSIPFGTLLINVTGAFAIALLFALATHHLLSPEIQAILATGFLGGYTTYSTLCWESVNLARGGRRILAQFYLVGSLLAGLLAGLVGVWLGGLFS